MANTKNILKNTLSNYAVITVRLFLAFFTTPIYLAVYGETLYGLFILSTSLVTSLTFLDFGAGRSLLKYTAEYMVDKDKKKFASAINTAISLNILSLGSVLLICAVLTIFVANLFTIPADEIGNAKLLFFIALLSTIFTFLDFIPSNILQGAAIFHRRNKYQLILIGVNIAIIIWVAFYKPGIIPFAWANMFLYVITYGIDFYLIRDAGLLKGISIKFIFGKQLFEQSSFSYTKEIFLLTLVGFFSSQADKFIVGSAISVSAVAIYTVVTRPYFLLKSFSSNIYSVLQPQFVKIKTAGSDVNPFIVKVTVIILGIYLFVMGNFVVFGQLFFEKWLRTDRYQQYFVWAVVAVFNWFVTGFTGFIYRAMFVTGETKKILRIDTYAATLNGMLSIVLTLLYGFQGVIIGTTVQMLILAVFMFKAGSKLYNIKLDQIFNTDINFLILIFAAIVVVQGYLTNWTYAADIALMLAEGLIFLLCFLIFLYREGSLIKLLKKS